MTGYSTGYYDSHLSRLVHNQARTLDRQMSILREMLNNEDYHSGHDILEQRLKVNALVITLRKMVSDIEINK